MVCAARPMAAIVEALVEESCGRAQQDLIFQSVYPYHGVDVKFQVEQTVGQSGTEKGKGQPGEIQKSRFDTCYAPPYNWPTASLVLSQVLRLGYGKRGGTSGTERKNFLPRG